MAAKEATAGLAFFCAVIMKCTTSYAIKVENYVIVIDRMPRNYGSKRITDQVTATLSNSHQSYSKPR